MRRAAITLVEVLLVVAIIGVLIALLIPAVQAARESSRRTQCASNLGQIALALHQYEDVHGVLPVYAFNNYSFHVYLLPFVEHEALYQKFDLEINAMDYDGPLRSVRVSIYECPSDSSRFSDDGVELAAGELSRQFGQRRSTVRFQRRVRLWRAPRAIAPF